ncbi:MAG: glycosyltransferase family 9 protein [Candidatus Sumerlaeia bacterium]
MSRTPESILIVRLSAIGDVVHTMPCLHALRDAFPKARIGWLVEELSASLLRDHPEIDQLYAIPKKRWRQNKWRTVVGRERMRFYKQIRRDGWEVAIDFQGLTKSAMAMWRSGAKRRIGYGDADGRELSKLFYTDKVRPRGSAVHVIERNLALLGPLGLERGADDVVWRFPDFHEEEASLRPFLDGIAADGPSSGEGSPDFIGLYPGAGWITKRWPPEKFVALARQLARQDGLPPMVLIWGPAEAEMVDAIIQQADLPAEKLRPAPPTNLRELTALLGYCSVMVAGDTGPMHIAAALGKRVVGLYGGSDPVRNGPWGRGHIVLEMDDMPCQPCWKRECPKGPGAPCMEGIAVELVSRAVSEIYFHL